MTIRLLAAAALALACASPTATPAPTETAAPLPPSFPLPTDAPTPSPIAFGPPPACSDATLVYDTHHARLTLTTCVNQLDPADHEQLWTWDGAEWALIFDEGPPPVVVTAAAWDIWNEVLIRYGGLPMDSNDCVAETWRWVGIEWHKMPRTAEQHPTACDHMKMTYDSVNRMTLLVGGGKLQDLSPETWGWDGEAWSLLATSGPPPRAHHRFVYDANHEQALLYGGIDNTSIFDDFWSWDGQTWAELDFAGPGTRSHFGMAVNAEGLLLFGGATGNSTFATLTADTWFLTDGAWTNLDIPGPSPRGSPALAWDPGREIWVLYGGFDATGAELSDTWEFDGTAWSCVSGC